MVMHCHNHQHPRSSSIAIVCGAVLAEPSVSSSVRLFSLLRVAILMLRDWTEIKP